MEKGECNMPCNGCVNISSLRDALVNTVVKIVDDNKKTKWNTYKYLEKSWKEIDNNFYGFNYNIEIPAYQQIENYGWILENNTKIPKI